VQVSNSCELQAANFKARTKVRVIVLPRLLCTLVEMPKASNNLQTSPQPNG
jgi:hypothetical protein